MNSMRRGLLRFYAGVFLVFLGSACSRDDRLEPVAPLTPQELLASAEWRTIRVWHKAADTLLPFNQAPARKYAGFETYGRDGTFVFRDAEGGVSAGNWDLNIKDSVRTLVFSTEVEGRRVQRLAPVTELTSGKFTYEIQDTLNNVPIMLLVEHVAVR